MAENVKNSKKTGGMKSFIGGTILTDERVTRQLPFILFWPLLEYCSSPTGNWSERTIRRVEVLQDTIDELRFRIHNLVGQTDGRQQAVESGKKSGRGRIGTGRAGCSTQKTKGQGGLIKWVSGGQS
jgi:hypothetical protein